jgi:hypothetical protein
MRILACYSLYCSCYDCCAFLYVNNRLHCSGTAERIDAVLPLVLSLVLPLVLPILPDSNAMTASLSFSAQEAAGGHCWPALKK